MYRLYWYDRSWEGRSIRADYAGFLCCIIFGCFRWYQYQSYTSPRCGSNMTEPSVNIYTSYERTVIMSLGKDMGAAWLVSALEHEKNVKVITRFVFLTEHTEPKVSLQTSLLSMLLNCYCRMAVHLASQKIFNHGIYVFMAYCIGHYLAMTSRSADQQ